MFSKNASMIFAVPSLRPLLFGLYCWLIVVATAGAQPPQPIDELAADEQIQFSFSGASWRSVLEWLADESDLALHVGETPTGSFTYFDRRFYTPDEAINRINQFLIPKGFSLVRSGKLLSVISIEDTRSLRQLDVLAELIPLDELPERGDFEVVKCLFPLGKADTESAVRELAAVTLMTEPVQLPSTNQLLITDTASKLRTVQKIIASLTNPDTTPDRVRSIQLKDINANAVLEIVRPHVGLEGDTLIGGDISLSTDATGKTLFVSGTKEQVDIVVSLVQSLLEPAKSQDGDEKRTLQSHPVKAASLRAVFDVLQTILSGEDARIEQERVTNSIVAYGPQHVHDAIEKTISTLQGSVVAFKIIELKMVDPYYAVALLNAMFIEPESEESEAADVPTGDKIRIDADPINMRLLVRAKQSQIVEMEKVIAQLDSANSKRSTMRYLPYFGTQGKQILDTARDFWPDQTPVIVIPHGQQFQVPERTLHPRETEKTKQQDRRRLQASPKQIPSHRTRPRASATAVTFVNQLAASRQSVSPDSAVIPLVRIRSQLTPRGILIQSEDLNALDRFEDHLRMIAGPAQGQPMQPAVYYLKYAPVDEAARLLRDFLSISRNTQSSFGSLVGASPPLATTTPASASQMRVDGQVTEFATPTARILTDARLDRLIVIGTALDIALIERYLPIIDKEMSLTDPTTHGMPRVLELLHVKAESAAAVIRDAYAGRIASTRRERQQAQQFQRQQQQQQQRNVQNRNQREPLRTNVKEPKFTLAVDAQSNSLIITAPRQLADEVAQLARQIDNNGAQTINVVSLRGGTSTAYVREALEGQGF